MNAAVRDSDTLFAQAIEIASPEDRDLFLKNACADDPEMRREVERLVHDHFRAGAFLESPAAHVVARFHRNRDCQFAEHDRPRLIERRQLLDRPKAGFEVFRFQAGTAG